MTWPDETATGTNLKDGYVHCKWCYKLIPPTVGNCDGCGGKQ